MKAYFKKYTLNFAQPAGTSRGILRSKNTWFLYVEQGETIGVGECGMFRGLSIDDRDGFIEKLEWLCENINLPEPDILQELLEWPALRFGYEIAMKSFNSSDLHELFPSKFTRGEDGININGLIWMGDEKFMRDQIEAKLKQGFSCIKMKIGAIDWEKELALLSFIRKNFTSNEITLRVDANGAFAKADALEKLKQLSDFDLHSIEQPIKAGQLQEMARLCEETPLPIALDEELIGIFDQKAKQKLLEIVKPQYIILKPTLVGGFLSSQEWIELAKTNNCDWWITSALESNVGLNAIAQWTYSMCTTVPQGLGTGSLFTNQIDAPLTVNNGYLHYNPNQKWQDLKNI